MNIQELITEGHSRKVAKEQDEYEARVRREEKEQYEHAKSWQPILQRVEKCIPAELAHALITPEHQARIYDGGITQDAQFTICIPKTDIHIRCDPETRWRMEDVPVFRPMRPVPYWDDDVNIGVSWQECGQWGVDFLIALAEAAEKAEELPAVINECESQAAELREKMNAPKPEPAPESTPAQDDEPLDYLDKAIEVIDKIDFVADEFAVICVQTAQAHALIAIAQELRVFNYRSKRGG